MAGPGHNYLEGLDEIIEKDLSVQLAHIDLALARLNARRTRIVDLIAKDVTKNERNQNILYKLDKKGSHPVYSHKTMPPLKNTSNETDGEDIARIHSYSPREAGLMSCQLDYRTPSAGEAIMISELKKTPSTPFNGNPIDFQRWYTHLSTKIDELHIGATDAIEIFVANTIGKPRDLVEMISASYGTSSEAQLSEIKSELIKRYGSKKLGAYIIYNNLMRHPKVEGAEESLQMARSLRSLSDACSKVGKAVQNTTYLDH